MLRSVVPVLMNNLWTVVILQAISTAVLCAGIWVNNARNRRLRMDLIEHRVRLEKSLAHLEAELTQLQARNGLGKGAETHGPSA